MKYKNKIKKYKIVLKNISPFILGTGEEGINNLLIIDGKAKIPATTIAGLFRSYLREEKIHEDLYKAVYLEDFESSNMKKSKLKFRKKSMLYVEDLYSKEKIDFNKNLSKRTHIKINKETGVSEDDHLFDSYHINPGQSFVLEVEMRKFLKDNNNYNENNIDNINSIDEKLLSDLILKFEDFLKEIQSEKIKIGGNTNKGFGKFKILKWGNKEYELTIKEDTSNYLLNKDILLDDYNVEIKNTNENIEKITFTCKEGLLIKDNTLTSDENIKESYSENSEDSKNAKYLIPASTIKGMMRNYFERIIPDKELIDKFFGSNERKGLINIEDIYIGEKSEDTNKSEKVRTRIKIDRFTGGALTGAMIKERPVCIKSPKEINIDLSYFNYNKDKTELNLIKRVLCLFKLDLENGKIRIGSNQSIGYGKLEYSKKMEG